MIYTKLTMDCHYVSIETKNGKLTGFEMIMQNICSHNKLAFWQLIKSHLRYMSMNILVIPWLLYDMF